MNNYSILLVDDDPLLLLSIGKSLEKDGYQITSTDSGERAIEMLHKEPFDLIITDLVMQPIDGIEILKKAKEINADIMVIILTGYADMASAVEIFREGADDYLAKPCQPEEIHFRLNKCFEKLENRRKVKQAEEALKESEERYNALFNGITDAVLVHHITDDGLPGPFIEANEIACRMLGYSRDELMGKGIGDIDAPESTVDAFHIVEELKAGRDVLFEQTHAAKDGHHIPVEVHAQVFDFRGRPAILSTVRDISERKLAEAALRESEIKLKTIFENVRDEIVCIDRHGTIIDVNRRVEDIFGYKPEEILGKKFTDIGFFSPEEFEEPIKLFEDAISGGPTALRSLTAMHKNGSKVFIEASTGTIKENGELKYLLTTIRDISERKIEEREKSKLQDQLQQSHKMEAIGTLAGGIAHEFNNILGIIVGNTELAMSGVPEWDTAHDCLKEIRSASLRARDIIKQILAFSRQTKPELKPVHISPLIDDSINFIRSSIPSSIKIKKEISAKLDSINADANQINQILLNLCTNAAHAMRNKGGILKISLINAELDENAVEDHEGLNPGNYVKLTVRDTGCGIDQQNIEHIFDPFFTTKEVGEGTGMGLSVIHGIVKEHNGCISVQSDPGKGTTFHILLPVTEEQVESGTDSEESLLKGRERILFVDDEEVLVFATKNNLEGMGYDVVTNKNPINALEIFKRQPDKFDLVITDMTMPDMTGDRLATEIMKISPNTPIIICTGHSDRMSEEEAKEMGISAYVMKPYLANEMATAIRLVLDKGKGKRTHKRASILVVDDEEQIRSTLKQMLESSGYEVMEAPDGNVALWLFKDKPSDLIITDLIMPEKEGIETIMELKRDYPGVKIIAISGGGTGDPKDYLKLAKQIGADSTLAKPFEKDELLKAIDDLLS